MLQSIRDKATGWIAYVIIGLIAIPFALWGIGEYFGAPGPLVAAEVNGQEIPVRLVHQETREQRQQLARMFGGQIPDELFDERAIRDAALESLIQRELLRKAAEDAGFRASDEAVVREIRAIPAFHDNGRFTPERYRTLLEAQRMSPGDFERDVAQSIKLAQIQQAIEASGHLPMAAAAEYSRLRHQVRVASWGIFRAADFDRPEVVEDAAVVAYYNENPERFTTPERLQIEYLRLDPRVLEADIDLTEEEIREHYQATSQRYAEPELRRVRQILVTAMQDDPEARARELRARLEQQEDFLALATAYSEDPLSAPRGGNMGQIARGDLDRVLETVIFSLPEGLISQPVQTRLGWHIVEVTDIQRSRPQPFEAVREQVENDLRDRRAERRQIQILDDLLAQTFENPGSLEPAARVTGLEIQTTDWFTRDDGDGVAQVRAVREAAFSRDVRLDERNSEPVDLPDGTTVVLRLHAHQEPALRPLDQVEADIRDILREDAAAQAAREQGEAVLDALAEHRQTVAELAAAAPEAWVQSVPVNRSTGPQNDVEMPSALMEHLFRMPVPAESRIGHSGVRLAGGDYAVILLESVETVSLAEMPVDLRRVAQDLQIAYSGAEMRAYLAWLESEAKVERFPENLE